MTDRELLELAAKAAGIDADDIDYEWNPLTDDGDALRLAVSLRIIHRNPPSMSQYIRASGECYFRKICADEPIKNDPYAATRRAIVRAAAEIGKGMP